MDFFQVQPSSVAQRHLARILQRQSCVFEAEGNRIMHSAFSAAAREALKQISDISKVSGLDGGELSTGSLRQQVFDDLVEPWHR